MDGFATVALVLLWLINLIVIILLIGTLRHLAVVYDLIDPLLRMTTNHTNLRAGRALPAAMFESLVGTSLEVGRFGAASLLLVVQPECQPCKKLLDGLGSTLVDAETLGWHPIIIVRAERVDAARLQQEHRLDGITVAADPGNRTGMDWGITLTPFAAVTDVEGKLRQQLPAVTLDDLRRVLSKPPASATLPVFSGGIKSRTHHREATRHGGAE